VKGLRLGARQLRWAYDRHIVEKEVEADGSHVQIEGKQVEDVLFEPERCWGCGLCASLCPSDAIVMARLEGEGV
jgi:Pyruvate/2-oxoacid:ferredoxin oxidoreductase delta subunit